MMGIPPGGARAIESMTQAGWGEGLMGNKIRGAGHEAASEAGGRHGKEPMRCPERNCRDRLIQTWQPHSHTLTSRDRPLLRKSKEGPDRREDAVIQGDRMENCLNSAVRHVGCIIPRYA